MRIFYTLENAGEITPEMLANIKKNFRDRPIVLVVQDAGESDLDEHIKAMRETITRESLNGAQQVPGTLEDLKKKYNIPDSDED